MTPEKKLFLPQVLFKAAQYILHLLLIKCEIRIQCVAFNSVGSVIDLNDTEVMVGVGVRVMVQKCLELPDSNSKVVFTHSPIAKGRYTGQLKTW